MATSTTVSQQINAPTKGLLIDPAKVSASAETGMVNVTLRLDQLVELYEALESHKSSWRVKVDTKSANRQLASRNKRRAAKGLAPVEQHAEVRKVILDGGKARYHGPRCASNPKGDGTYSTQELVNKFSRIMELYRSLRVIIQEQA